MDTLEEIRSFVGDDENNGSNSIAEFPFLTKNAVESLRYRAEVIYRFLLLLKKNYHSKSLFVWPGIFLSSVLTSEVESYN